MVLAFIWLVTPRTNHGRGVFSQVVCHAELLQSHPAFWDPMDCSPQCSSVHGIVQASILEWLVISFSRGYSWPRDGTHVSCLSCIASEFFTTEPPGKPLVTTYANSRWYQHLRWLVMLGPEVLTQVMDFPFCGLFLKIFFLPFSRFHHLGLLYSFFFFSLAT